jgi:RimJ/RimL family protein N-acetyltransferase
MTNKLFFQFKSVAINYHIHELDFRFTIKLWRPRPFSLAPKGFPHSPFYVWWAFHYLHLFYNNDYAILLIYDGGRIIHRSCIFPGYFRFPFMGENDLQIGDTWTDLRYRNQGLATLGLSEAIKRTGKQGRIFWYVVAEDNVPSIHVAEKIGFRLFGNGERTKRFGFRALGSFMLER